MPRERGAPSNHWRMFVCTDTGVYWVVRFREGFAEVAFGDSFSEKIRWRLAMAERRIGQLSFADGLVADAGRPNAMLKRVGELVDWKEIEAVAQRV